MLSHPYMVLVPSRAVDETTIGEWLEQNHIDYVAVISRTIEAAFEYRFKDKEKADLFARTFIG